MASSTSRGAPDRSVISMEAITSWNSAARARSDSSRGLNATDIVSSRMRGPGPGPPGDRGRSSAKRGMGGVVPGLHHLDHRGELPLDHVKAVVLPDQPLVRRGEGQLAPDLEAELA